MPRYTNPPPTAPKWLAEKFAKLSQQHMERQEQQRQQKKGKNIKTNRGTQQRGWWRIQQ